MYPYVPPYQPFPHFDRHTRVTVSEYEGKMYSVHVSHVGQLKCVDWHLKENCLLCKTREMTPDTARLSQYSIAITYIYSVLINIHRYLVCSTWTLEKGHILSCQILHQELLGSSTKGYIILCEACIKPNGNLHIFKFLGVDQDIHWKTLRQTQKKEHHYCNALQLRKA